MRCLIVVPSLRRAGAETQAIDLANGLASRGHSTHVFSFMTGTDQRNRLDRAVKFHYHLRKQKYSIEYIAKLTRLIDEEQIDVIHCVIQHSALVSWIAAKLSKRMPPLVAAIHTTINYDVKSELADRLLYRHVLNRAASVVFVCKHQQEHWLEKYQSLSARSVVVYNGIDAKRFNSEGFALAGHELRNRLAIDQDMFMFCCIAAFRPEKGHDLLVKAFAGLPQHAVLVLAGDGIVRSKIEKLVKQLAVTERVKLLGNLSDVRPLLAASDASILASTAETFSMAMLESLAMRTPVIAPHIGGLSEAIVDGETGMLFPVGDYHSMTKSMLTMMKSSRLLETMGRLGEQKVRREFSLDTMIRESESVLFNAIDYEHD